MSAGFSGSLHHVKRCIETSFYYFSVCFLTPFPPRLPPLILSIQYFQPPPPNHWRCEQLGVTLEGRQACDTFKCIYILYCWTVVSQLWYTLEGVWEPVSHYPWIWKGLAKREGEKDILPSFCILFLNFFLCYHLEQVFACARSLRTSPTEKATTQGALFTEHLAGWVVLWGFGCQSGSQSRRMLE